MSVLGSITDLPLSDVLQLINFNKRSAILTIETEDGKSSIVFKHGLIVNATSPSAKIKSVCQRLLNKIVTAGYVDRRMLQQIAKTRIKETIQHVMEIQDGRFTCDLKENTLDNNGEDPLEVILETGLNPNQLLLEIAIMHDRSHHSQEEDGLNANPQEFGFPDSRMEDFKESNFFHLGGSEFIETVSQIGTVGELFQKPRSFNRVHEISLDILQCAEQVFDRGLLFQVKREEAIPLGGFGDTGEEEALPQKVGRLRIPLSRVSVFSRVVQRKQTHIGELCDHSDSQFISLTGRLIPPEMAVVPLLSRNEVIGLVYGDNAVTRRPISELQDFETKMVQAANIMENAILHRKIKQLKARNGFLGNRDEFADNPDFKTALSHCPFFASRSHKAS